MATNLNIFGVSSEDLVSVNKIDGLATSGLAGVSNSLAYRIHEIEAHLHSSASWFGAAGTPSATHFADRIGTSGMSIFRLDSGNQDWGTWVQLFGSEDTPARGSMAYFDTHEMVITANERAGVYFIQFGHGASGEAALTAGSYTEVALDLTDKAGGAIVRLQTGHAPAGSLLWARCMTPAFDTGTLDFYIGIHEYVG
jgi:hypothetical protein